MLFDPHGWRRRLAVAADDRRRGEGVDDDVPHDRDTQAIEVVERRQQVTELQALDLHQGQQLLEGDAWGVVFYHRAAGEHEVSGGEDHAAPI